MSVCLRHSTLPPFVPPSLPPSLPLSLPPSLPPSISISPRKPTKGIQYLVMEGVLQDDPQAVADFLIGNDKLSKEKIGEFLGEINSEFNMAVLE